MSELALFIIGVGVFTVTLMAVLWTGYIVFDNRFEADLADTRTGGKDRIGAVGDTGQFAEPSSPAAT